MPGAEAIDWDYVDRRFGCGRRHAGGAPGRSRACASSCSRPAAIRARAPRACPTTTTCRPSMPSPARTRRMSWNFRVRHYEDEAAAGEGLEVRGGAGRALSARRGAGRLHLAQRDDLHAAARLGLGPHRAAHRRLVLARDAHAPVRAARGGLPAPAGVARACGTSGSTRPATAGMAGCKTEKSIPLTVLGDDGLVRVLRDTARTFTRSLPTPAAQHLALGARRPGATRTRGAAVRQLRGHLLHAARDLGSSAHRRARAAARGRRAASRPPAHRTRCARHARAVRCRRRSQWRRVPEGRTPVSRPCAAERCRLASDARCGRGAR